MLRGNWSYMNKELAAFYGVSGPAGPTFEKVMLNATQRGGVLTQGAFLAANAGPRQSSPVARGVYVRERLLCSPPPPPPPNIPRLKEPDGKSSTRERLAQHRSDPACAGCHTLFDPLGLGFEHYDAVGKWRDTDAGKTVDATGEINGTDIDGAFDGALDLATRMAGSAQVRDCLVRQWFRFGYARGEQESDRCTLDALNTALSSNGNNIRELAVALTQADPFLYRTAEKAAP
jgi:hypothetical protein